VRTPTKYDLVLNRKTAKALGIRSRAHLKIAKALGLTVPPTLLARADKVTE